MKNVLFILLVILMTACMNQEEENIPLSENGKIAQRYLEEKGYKVVSHEGERTKIFTKADLTESPDKELWEVQYIAPDKYVGKEILMVKFFIKNHPLDHEYDGGKTSVTLMMLNKEVIGGESFPYSKANDLIGVPYSLDGKTAEEVQNSK